MAALNVDYIKWIITVLGAINSNLTFIFDLNYFLWKLKTLKRQGVSSLLETKHKVFRFKTKSIPRIMSIQDAKSSLKMSPTLNFQSLWQPAGRNFGAPKNIGDLCFQDTRQCDPHIYLKMTKEGILSILNSIVSP